jgi:transglutaminase-like putative cysteine protease
MLIRIGFEIEVACPKPTPMLLALYPHPDVPPPTAGTCEAHADPATPIETYADPFGNRCGRLVAPEGRLFLWSDCIVPNDGTPDAFDWSAVQTPVPDLPPDTLGFLVPSRYCESDLLADDAWRLFGTAPTGWARVQAIANWVHNHVLFDYRFGRPTKTAADVFREGTGVCRDFAHLFVALCRAMNFPARYVSGYLGDIGVEPGGAGDFSAWAEVYVGGRWHVFDARYNTPRIGRIPMVRGRDAADVGLVTGFGAHTLRRLKVWTFVVDADASVEALASQLQTRPDVEELVLQADITASGTTFAT